MSEPQWEIDSNDFQALNRMRMALDEYQMGRVSLAELVEDLNSFNASLVSPPAGWRERFISEWEDLEEAYRVMHNRGESILRGREEARVRGALKNLRSMVWDLMTYKSDHFRPAA